MSVLTSEMDTALSGTLVTFFDAIEIALPAATIRWITGSSEVTFFGHTYKGIDPTYGVLASFEEITDGTDAEAPSMRIVINPPNTTSAATLANPLAQGGAVQWWRGVINTSDGSVIPSPQLIFVGELDVPTLEISEDDRQIEFECVSVFERFFDDNEGQRMTNAFQQDLWPGDKSFEYMVSIQQYVPWMSDAQKPVLIKDILR